MISRHLARWVGPLLVASLFVLVFIPSIARAADQVILTWEQDADGNPIDVGQVIDDEYHSATAISVTIKTVSSTNVAAIFPSDDLPLRSGVTVDPDLGSPNASCPGGGPGIGVGGEVGEPGENCLSHENVLIMPTTGDSDSDGFIAGIPDDDDQGGTISFYFSEPVAIDFAEMLDQESEENLTINSYADVAGTTLIDEQNPSGYGDNSYENVVINAAGIRRVDFVFLGSGAIASLAFTPEEPTAVNISAFSAAAVAPGYLLLAAAFMMVLFTAAAVWLLRLYAG